MIGIEKCETTTTMINEVNTMTPRQNDLVVKKLPGFNLATLISIHDVVRISFYFYFRGKEER